MAVAPPPQCPPCCTNLNCGDLATSTPCNCNDWFNYNCDCWCKKFHTLSRSGRRHNTNCRVGEIGAYGGQDVAFLQRLLQTWGYYRNSCANEIKADGIFDSCLEAAVKCFQEEHGLTPDGVVGTATWSRLQFGMDGGSVKTACGDGFFKSEHRHGAGSLCNPDYSWDSRGCYFGEGAHPKADKLWMARGDLGEWYFFMPGSAWRDDFQFFNRPDGWCQIAPSPMGTKNCTIPLTQLFDPSDSPVCPTCPLI